MKTVTRKIGSNRGRPRLWLEGKLLSDAGFKPGDRYDRTFGSGLTILLQKRSDGAYTVSGKGEKPIIDIAGADLIRAFSKLGVMPKSVSVKALERGSGIVCDAIFE